MELPIPDEGVVGGAVGWLVDDDGAVIWWAVPDGGEGESVSIGTRASSWWRFRLFPLLGINPSHMTDKISAAFSCNLILMYYKGDYSSETQVCRIKIFNDNLIFGWTKMVTSRTGESVVKTWARFCAVFSEVVVAYPNIAGLLLSFTTQHTLLISWVAATSWNIHQLQKSFANEEWLLHFQKYCTNSMIPN